MISGKAKIAGVIGWPVSHSLSPRLHQYWLRENGIDGAYVPLVVTPDNLGDAIRALPKLGFRGINLTIPHKEAVMTFCDEIDATAKKIGAVNTLIIENGRIAGANTDAYGFMENVRPRLQGKAKAVVLGAGGAARAVCHALTEAGFKEIVVTNRTLEKAQSLATEKIAVAPWEERSTILERADLLVNTTSLGMTGKEALEIDLSALPKTALVTDIVYKPLMPPLLEKAKARGNPVVDGLGMLIYQAVPGFEAWFGVRPAVTEELRQYLLHG
ncbi:MAG: shikimate dehydrogenase [Pseudomonadota bacterium]|nr:shikimate dehydrogenase [Pseudomonadota bacterium]